MKKIRLNNANGDVLLPSTDIYNIKNCPVVPQNDSVKIGLNSLDTKINFNRIFFSGDEFSISGVDKIQINGDLYLADPYTKNESVYLSDYPVNMETMNCFSDFLGVVAPLTQPSTECYFYPGFVLLPQEDLNSHSKEYYYINENGKLAKMDPNTQKFVPLGSKTIY